MLTEIVLVDTQKNHVRIPLTEINNRCRTCLINNGELNIFTTKHQGIMFHEMLDTISLPKTQASDGLPQKICGTCAKIFIQFYSLKRQAEQLYRYLKYTTNLNNIENDGPSEKKDAENTCKEKQINKSKEIRVSLQKTKQENENISNIKVDKMTNEIMHVGFKECMKVFGNNLDKIEIKNEDLILTDHDYTTVQSNTVTKIIKQEPAMLKCKVCGLEFTSDIKYEDHMKKEMEKRIMSKPLRNKEISACKKNGQNNINTKNNLLGGKYNCDFCKIQFKTNAAYLFHKSRRCPYSQKKNHVSLNKNDPNIKKEQKRYFCKTCNTTFLMYSLFVNHSHSSYLCDQCGNNYTTKNRLDYHIKFVHTQMSSFKCEICDEIFTERSQLMNHTKIHIDEKPLPSSNTGDKKDMPLTSVNKYIQVRNIKETTHEIDQKYFCTGCNLYTKILSIHKKIHKEGHRFICDVCYMTFNQKDLLLDHNKNCKTEQKDLTCELCGKTFIRKQLAENHRRIHTGEKPYTCNVCGKRFIQKGHVDNHIKIHKSEKDHICPYCNKAFILNGNLKQHIQVHLRQKHFVCRICSKEFVTHSDLTTHELSHTKRGNMVMPFRISR